MFSRNTLLIQCCALLFTSTQGAALSQNLKILIVGGGGREHALACKVVQSPHVAQVFIAPGNGGTERMQKVRNVALKPTDIDALVSFASHEKIDLVIVGPEAPLAAGITDALHRVGIACLGPTQAAAQIETSKHFAKEFMTKHGIPTASYEVITSLAQAEAYIETHNVPLVVKADGLTGGKGVIIAQTKQKARQAAHDMLSGAAFGKEGQTIVCEEFLQGQEVSFIVLTDGTHCIPLATSQDYKKLCNGDEGLMTGGMGACSPAPCITPELHSRIMREIIDPTLKQLAADGTPFVGFLYAGLIITPDGNPYVLEFNCRLGDPEAQVILPLMQTDLVTLGLAAVQQKLHTMAIEWDPRKAVTVVIADSGYPKPCYVGQSIDIHQTAETTIYHAATKWNDTQLVSTGGRILAVTALADSLDQAREKAYAGVQGIQLPHMQYRTDIAEQVR
jgi:phosphoribosylamine---glycine ligase